VASLGISIVSLCIMAEPHIVKSLELNIPQVPKSWQIYAGVLLSITGTYLVERGVSYFRWSGPDFLPAEK